MTQLDSTEVNDAEVANNYVREAVRLNQSEQLGTKALLSIALELNLLRKLVELVIEDIGHCGHGFLAVACPYWDRSTGPHP